MLALLTASCGDSSTGPTLGPPARASAVGGSDQVAVIGQPVAVAPAVLVTDESNQPLPGITVTFAVTAGGGTVAPTPVSTDARGEARTTWTLGNTFVQNTLTATVFGLPSVIFTARAVAPDTPILAFSVSDPGDDTLAATTNTAPRAHDVLSIRGDFKRDSLIVTVSFVAPVAPAAPESSNSLLGFVEFDMDDNVATGESPLSNVFGASASLGIDYAIDLFGSTSTSSTVVSVASGVETSVPASFSGSTVVVRIPMSVIGSDDGNFGLVGVIGTFDRPTDLFPNSGQTTSRRALGLMEETLGHATPTRSTGRNEVQSSRVQQIWRNAVQLSRGARNSYSHTQ